MKEENEDQEATRDAYAPAAHTINLLLLVVLVAIVYSGQSETITWFILILGGVFTLVNLVCMITFMIKGYIRSWLSYLLWVVVLPAATGVCWLLSVMPRGKIGG